MFAHTRSRTVLTALVLAVAASVLAACGTRLSHEEIVAATQVTAQPGAGGALTDAQGNPITGSDGALAGTGSGTEGGATGTSGTAAPGASGSTAGGSGTTGAAGGDGSKIVIGTVGQYSGPVGSALSPGARALQAWAASVNAKGGVAGHPVEVIVYDDGGDGAKALSQVRELVEERHGVALVSSMGSNTLSSWKGYVEDKGVPVIGGDCALQDWHESPMLFSQCPSLDSQLRGLLELGATQGVGDKFGLLSCQEAPACAYGKERIWDQGWAKQAGLDPVYTADISIAQPDFTAECVQARDAGVEIMTVGADANTVARVASSCQRQGFSPQFLQISATGSHQMASQPGLGNALLSVGTFPFEGVNSPAIAEYQAAWSKYGSGDSHPAASLGWAGAELFEKAVLSAGGSVTSDSLAKALYSIKNENLGGLTVPLSYKAGQGTVDSPCWFGMKAGGGGWSAINGGKPIC
jgi:branched-chain amino acid transport system substrate-binding protein